MSVIAVDEKKKKDDRIPTWMIAGGIAAVFAVFTAVTVYQIKKSRKQQLREARYGEDYPESTVNSKLTKYWSLTTRTFRAVSKVIGEFLTTKGKTVTPMVNAAEASSSGLFHSDEGEL